MGSDFHCNHKFEEWPDGTYHCKYCGLRWSEQTTTSDNTTMKESVEGAEQKFADDNYWARAKQLLSDGDKEYQFSKVVELLAENEQLKDAIKSRNILQAEDRAKLQLYEGLLKEVLEYEKRTVAPRPPHPYYTIVSRITEALKQQ